MCSCKYKNIILNFISLTLVFPCTTSSPPSPCLSLFTYCIITVTSINTTSHLQVCLVHLICGSGFHYHKPGCSANIDIVQVHKQTEAVLAKAYLNCLLMLLCDRNGKRPGVGSCANMENDCCSWQQSWSLYYNATSLLYPVTFKDIFVLQVLRKSVAVAS